MAVWDLQARLWTVARKLEDLLELQTKTRTALEAVEVRLRGLEDRMTHLEAGQRQVITEAKAAAGIAAAGLYPVQTDHSPVKRIRCEWPFP